MSQPFVRPDVRQFLDLLKKNSAPALGSIPIEQSRSALRATQPLIEAEPRSVAHVADISCPGPGGKIAMRYYDDREERTDAPLVVFFHGGGFVLFDIDHYDSVVREIAIQTKLPVVSVEYRLAPENPFPAAPEDCEAATRWLVSAESILPFCPTGIILAGDSGGGNLAIVSALELADSPAAKPVIALATIYPAVSDSDRAASTRNFAEGYVLDRSSLLYFIKSYRAPKGDPRYHVIERDLSVLPPTLVMTATLDPLHDQGIAFVEKLKKSGVRVRHYEAEGNIHGLIMYRKICPSSQGDLENYLSMFNEMMDQLSK